MTKPAWDRWSTTEISAIDTSLEHAEPKMITDAFARLVPNFASNEWLAATHPVVKNPYSVRHASATAVKVVQISDYAAASVPLHVADSWTYFGRAMSALAFGSPDVAQHLLYYSELRAMHALLFRQGVVHLGGRNLVFGANSMHDVPFPTDTASKRMAGNSHQAIWVLFRHWLRTGNAADFCERTVQLRGVSLGGWIQARPTPRPFRPILVSLMEKWGVDVARFSSDRELRNRVSYNPTRMTLAPTGATPDWVGSTYRQVWSLLEPNGGNAFENLDRFIIRDTARALSDTDPKPVKDAFRKRGQTINRAWADAVLGMGSGDSVASFFDESPATAEPDLLASAGTDFTTGSLSDQLTGMIGRALVLLRFATGAVRDLLTESGCSASAVDFWVSDMLTLHGIRRPEGNPPDYFDLYADVSDVIDELTVLDGVLSPDDFAVIGEMIAQEVQILSGFERVPAWAVA